MYNNSKPMCYDDLEDLAQGDFETRDEPNHTGGRDKVTRFRDGTAIHHFGGPVGDVRTDKLGEEC